MRKSGKIFKTFILHTGENIMSYADAKKVYAAYGVDTDKALDIIKNVSVSLHCWQGDDVRGFDTDPSKPLTGGIQTTGNYPGRAGTPEELMADIDEVLKLVPGKIKMNLHASYAIFDGEHPWVDRDKLAPAHFEKWVDFCKERGLGCDFNPTFFSHPKCDPLTLSSPNEETRKFWIEHGKASIRISQYLAEQLGQPCIMNIWTGDGFKDIPGDRIGPRVRYKEAIDEILSEPYDFRLVKPTIESKVFGIGVEAYTVGSAEFALSYAAANMGKCIPLMDNGHYHPTEVVSDKIPALLAFFPEIALHITRPIRWDSDHVVLFDDETKEICREIVRCGGLDGKVNIALDYFDASINRISAWVTGVRNLQKSLLFALLQPNDRLKELQDESDFTQLMVLQEELKTAPFYDVWQEYLARENKPAEYFAEIKRYENEVLSAR
jgi:L-rhamnose isomerase